MHAAQQNVPVEMKWEIFARNLIQCWEYRYWSGLPAVRQNFQWNWFNLYAMVRYG